MKTDVRKVSRTVEGVGGTEEKTKEVTFEVAETIEECLAYAENKMEKLLAWINQARWAEIRVATSNELAGGSVEDKAFSRIVKAVSKLSVFAGKTEDEISSVLRSNPAMLALFSK